MFIQLAFLLFIFHFVSSEIVRYDNYSLYKVYPKNLDHVKLLQDVQSKHSEYDFWDDITIDNVNIMSKPEMKTDLEILLQVAGINFEVTLENVQEVINKQTKKNYVRNDVRSMKWDSYYNLEDINSWLDDLVTAYPKTASIVIGGESHEGREIKGIKISHGADKRAVFIESGIHAREWITPATTNFIINELLTSEDEEIQTIARNYDWYIFPVTNPDGYVYSHTNDLIAGSEDIWIVTKPAFWETSKSAITLILNERTWRKNRAPYGEQIGVDLNRNWDNNWSGVGTSNVSSSNIFAGSGPFSEKETRTLSNYIKAIAEDIDLYISFHSAGQILLLPFGNTTEPLANYKDALKVGRRALGALSVRSGTLYTSGNIAEAIYPATGGSIDWVKAELNIPLVYCYELRDRGTYGHLLPPEQILPTAEETMDSVVEMVRQAERFGFMNSGNSLSISILFIFGLIVKLIL